METSHFGLIGAGWRAEFYLRIAHALPERFHIDGMVVRDPAKGQALSDRWGIPTYRAVDDLLAACTPQFVVTSVPWEANPGLVRALAERDVPALSETPPAPDVERMAALGDLVAQGARIQVAEQYLYQPHHAARLAFVESGALGTVSQAQVSAAHGYHGTSLIRRFLGIGYENARITARAFRSPLVAGPGRDGPPSEETVRESPQTIAWLDWGDRLGVFDFTGDQYFSWVRHERLLVRGERGEIINREVSWLPSYDSPMTARFERAVAGAEGNLEGFYLKGIVAGGQWVYRNPFAPARLADDEIAIATVLQGMANYVAGGPEVYPLAEACQDHYLGLMIAQAVETGETVKMETQVWSRV